MPQESLIRRKQAAIAVLALVAIVVHLVLRFGTSASPTGARMLRCGSALALGGVPLVWELLVKLLHREFGSDLLAGISIVTSVLLDEYLAGTLVVLMLSGGEALEAYAVRSASSVLEALAKRMPSVAHRKQDSTIADVPLADGRRRRRGARVPARGLPGRRHGRRGPRRDGRIVSHGRAVHDVEDARLDRALRGDQRRIGADDPGRASWPVDSRYAKIMQVMQASEQQRPRIRRLGDQLGRVLHAGGGGDWHRGLAGERRRGAIPGGAGRGHAVSAVDRDSRWRSSARFRWRPSGRSSSTTRPCWKP